MDGVKKAHILVVDDEDNLLRAMVDLLEVEGYQVTPAVDGEHALETLKSMPSSPDLIISDIRMPKMDGYHFLTAVRERPEWLSIPFIFLTAKGEPEDIRYGKLRGVDDYVTKPFDFKYLAVVVQSVLRRRQELMVWHQLRMDELRHRILIMLQHEFRTPLQYIRGYANLIADSSVLTHSQSEELLEYIAGVREGSERLYALVESFLVLADLETGIASKVYDLRRAWIDDIPALVAEVIERSEIKIEKQGVIVETRVDADLPALLADRLYLEWTLWHLLDNAVKFSPAGVRAKVGISLSAEDGHLVFAVTDEGRGIPSEEQAQLFRALHQINRDKYETAGVGAGLAIASRVAELHGGSITLQSKAGLGSCFMLRLPGADLVDPPDKA